MHSDRVCENDTCLYRSVGRGGRLPFLSRNWRLSRRTNQPRRRWVTGVTGLRRAVFSEAQRPGSRIEVETKSGHYQIECLGENAVRISGHPEYCPNPVPARLHGSLDQEGVLEFGLIGRGM